MLRSLTKLSPHSLLGALVRLPLGLIPGHTVVTVRSGLNKGAAWIVGSSIHGCWLGTYEAEKQTLVEKFVRPGMTVWDVGANAGFYTLAFSRLVGPAGRVYAFEPFAENAQNLLKHVRLNALQNVVVVQAALGAETGVAGFHAAASNSMGCLSASDRAYLVPVLTADGFLDQHSGARPDLIKIDIEGAEAALLVGASQMLKAAAPTILLALHGKEQGVQCANMLASSGYSIHYLDGTAANERPLLQDEVYAVRDGAD